MRDWKPRDTVMVIFMIIVVIVMFMQMTQNDRLYSRINHLIALLESGGSFTDQGGASTNSTSTQPAPNAGLIVPGAEQGGSVVIHYPAQPANLNPVTYKDVYGGYILMDGGVYETLLDRDPKTLELTGSLAKSWTLSDDKTEITFSMKPEARWTDGRPVTAHDVVFSFQVMMLPTVDAQRTQTYYIDCEKVEAIDDHTVRFKWKKKYFKSLEQSGGFAILPKHAIDPGGLLESDSKKLAEQINTWNFKWEDRIPVSSGPYQLESWDTSANRAVLRRNERYWGPKPALQRIVFRFIKDDNASLQAIKAGDIDIMGLNAEQWQNQTNDELFLKQFEKRKYLRLDSGYNYLGWNLRRAPFDDRRIRQAMSYCIPRDKIAEKIFYKLREPVNGPFAPGSRQASPKVDQWPFDPAKGAAILAEAGYTDANNDGVLEKGGQPLDFSLIIPSGSTQYEQIVQIIQDEMAKIKVKMSINPIEWSVFTKKLDERDFDACMLGWSGSIENDPYQIWHSTSIENKGSNFIGYNNPEVDKLLVDARQEFDTDKRNAMYHRFHEILAEEQPYSFLFTGPSLLAQHKRVRNVNTYGIGLRFHEWWIARADRRSGE